MMQPVNIEGPLGSRIMAAHAVPLWVGGPERQVTIEVDVAADVDDVVMTARFASAFDLDHPDSPLAGEPLAFIEEWCETCGMTHAKIARKESHA